MGTSAEKLNKLKTTKDEIREAINNKGGILTESNAFSEYATAIDNIQTGGGVKDLLTIINGQNLFKGCRITDSQLEQILSYDTTSNVTNMNSMFYQCGNLTTIPQLDTSKVTNMNSMFYQCGNLTTIPQLNTSNVTGMNDMFYYCSNLTTIPQLNTSKVTSMAYTFYSCSNLTTIPQLDTSKVTNMECMIGYCTKLEKIDLTKMSDSNDHFAYRCYSLKTLIIRTMPSIPSLNSTAFKECAHFEGNIDSKYNPEGLKDGLIYVPDDKVESVKTATNWSVFADLIMPLSSVGQPYIYNITSNNRYTINKSTLFTVRLINFINTPEVIITSSNEEVATISNIIITTQKITFNANCLSIGTTTITVQITGDTSGTKTIDINVLESMKYTVEEIDGVTYGFTLNSNGYYESTNKGKSSSYSLCKLVFNATETNNILKLECINSGENNYDFGILSNIDTTLSLDNNTDSTNVYKSFSGQSSTSPVIITYPEATVGEHYIYIKYRKDGSGDNGNDSLQFKVIS